MAHLKHGQELSLGDRKIANDIIQSFEQRYKEATGTNPIPSIDMMLLFAPELEQYGFKFLVVDSWREDNWKWINSVLVEKGHKGWFGRRK